MIAKLEVKVYIPDERMDEWKRDGVSDKQIQRNIERAITLADTHMAKDIESVSLLSIEPYKYKHLAYLNSKIPDIDNQIARLERERDSLESSIFELKSDKLIEDIINGASL